MIIGTVASYTAGAGVTVTIDGESSATVKEYKFLSSYSPTVGDRVVMDEIGGEYVILGKITNTAGGGGGGAYTLGYTEPAAPTNDAPLTLKENSTVISTVNLNKVRNSLSVRDMTASASLDMRIYFRIRSSKLEWGSATGSSTPQTWHTITSS